MTTPVAIVEIKDTGQVHVPTPQRPTVPHAIRTITPATIENAPCLNGRQPTRTTLHQKTTCHSYQLTRHRPGAKRSTVGATRSMNPRSLLSPTDSYRTPTDSIGVLQESYRSPGNFVVNTKIVICIEIITLVSCLATMSPIGVLQESDMSPSQVCRSPNHQTP